MTTDLPSTRVVRASSSGPLWLVVFGSEQLATHALPASGAITIGRANKADIQIFEKSISRQHAVLRIGDTVTIEDLASANGTRVGGTALAPHAPRPVRQGDVVELGDVSILIQRRPAPMTTRRLWSHGYFGGRIEEELARAAEGSELSLVFLHCDPPPPTDVVQTALAEVLRQVDVAGEYGAGEYEMLLVDVPLAAAEQRAQALVERLTRRGVHARVGVASYPRDGRNAEQLLAHASAAARPSAPITPSGMVCEDPGMLQLRRVIDRVAPGMLSVLLIGETGVGKEGTAELVHRRSPRAGKPFLRLNCAALTESLLESELFGHEKGAFTGATATKPGLLETATGGTVFLDEIGEISASLQAKLLRVLEERVVMRVGGLRRIRIDVRFVAATNRDLELEIARGRFRQDLFYRLAGITLVIPPLRERTTEIAPLARSFIDGLAVTTRRRPRISDEALDVLERYAWPGNIRELRNVIERAVLLCSDGVIEPEHLPLEKMRATYPSYRPPVDPVAPAADLPRTDDTGPDPAVRPLAALYPGDAERDRIVAALEVCRGNQTRAAAILGMSRRTLIHRLERYALPRPRKG